MMMRKNFFPRSFSNREVPETRFIHQSGMDHFDTGISLSSRPWQYERIGGAFGGSSGSSSNVLSGLKKVIRRGQELKLGGNIPGSVRRGRVAKLHGFLLTLPSTLIGKAKEQYDIWKEGARCADLRVSDLFASNQLFMHPKTINSHKKQQQLKPSVGFSTRGQGPSTGQGQMLNA